MSNRRRSVVLVAALAAAVAAGGGAIWAAATDSALAAEASSRSVVVSPVESPPTGRTVEVRGPDGLPTAPVSVRVGGTLVVHLKEQAGSTGYAWSVRALPGNLTLVGDVVGPPESSLIGAPTDHAFRFRVTGPGTGKLSLSLGRGRRQSVQDVTVTVTAQA